MADKSKTGQTFFDKAFNLDLLTRKRLNWVDYLRGLTIILVVYRHVLIGLERSGLVIPNIFVEANMIFFTFRMPVFFILSGIFFQQLIDRNSIKKIVISKADLLLYPYLIWSIIQVSLQVIFSNYTNSERGLQDFLYILYQPRALDQMWFLPALFNTTLIYLFVRVKLKATWWIQICLGMLFYLIKPYIPDYSIVKDWMEFYIFFALGDIVSPLFRNDKFLLHFKDYRVPLLLFPVFIFTQLYFLHNTLNLPLQLFIALTGCAFMFAISFQLQRFDILRFLRIIGYHSLYIYVMHVIASALMRMLLMRGLSVTNSTILLSVGIITGILIPVMLYNLVLKDKGWFLFSLKRPLNKSNTADKAPASEAKFINVDRVEK